MDCYEFKQWLISRDDGDDRTLQRARRHREKCPNCGRLFVADEGLEQALSSGIRAATIPSGLAHRARALADMEATPVAAGWPVWFRKGLAPAFALGLMLVFVVFNPFAKPLTSLEVIGNYALANHTRPDMTMAFSATDTPDPQDWFFKRLNYRVTIPNFSQRGFIFRGGRQCTIGPKKAAYLFYDDNGTQVSVFVIPAAHVKIPMQADRNYRIDAPRHRMEMWKADGMICILVQDSPTAIPATT